MPMKHIYYWNATSKKKRNILHSFLFAVLKLKVTVRFKLDLKLFRASIWIESKVIKHYIKFFGEMNQFFVIIIL